MFFNRLYDDRAFPPEMLRSGEWNVWCRAGLLDVLRDFGGSAGGEGIFVNLANNAYVRAVPGDDVWMRLTDLASTHDVRVFRVEESAYRPWDANSAEHCSFDGLQINMALVDPGSMS